MINRVVIFNKYGAKKSIRPMIWPFFRRDSMVSSEHTEHVDHAPKMFWKKEGNALREMTRPEKLERLEQLAIGQKRQAFALDLMLYAITVGMVFLCLFVFKRMVE